MKQFFKFTLATIVGFIVASFLGMLLFFGVIGALASSGDKATELSANSVYELELMGNLVDRSQDDPFSAAFAKALGQPATNTVGLDDVLLNIEKAKNDPNISGIYLKGGMLMGGYASLKEIRDALVGFKASGKFVVAYADTYMQSNYYLASVADKVLLNPEGMLELKGLNAELLFLKNTFDKIGVDMQVVKVGTFKSAVEPYINTKMSDENRTQVSAYLGSIWKNVLSEISKSRKISVDTLNLYADEMMLFQPTIKNLKYGLVDSLVYADEVKGIIESYGGEFKTVKHTAMGKVATSGKFAKEKIAVVYAVGAIDGGDTEGIVSDKLVETINDVAKDDMVKAVVFRVSSPGGSAYGSEQIWRALSLLKEKKPLIVSMGDYAASGGYYIACMADTIVAQPNTITGSIGIFGLIPNIDGLNKKLGLSYDGVKTNKLSDAISINRAFRPEERDLMQAYVNRGYELFVKRCADGRGMSVEQIKAVAEGRVWTGGDAQKLGLVDVLGGLSDAVAIAIEKSGLEKYRVVEYPEKEDFATRLMKELGGNVELRIAKAKLGENYRVFEYLNQATQLQGIQARLPYELIIK
jgi:protease IV